MVFGHLLTKNGGIFRIECDPGNFLKDTKQLDNKELPKSQNIEKEPEVSSNINQPIPSKHLEPAPADSMYGQYLYFSPPEAPTPPPPQHQTPLQHPGLRYPYTYLYPPYGPPYYVQPNYELYLQ
ncbi:hypothetical protein BDP27DRAFT_1369140 [Rhodocollybia butyracea]|uniref:Uncharacterized protein n=1 Tax=Rhodocollybia butyracea TaxID=206335 RepID=A0A9P5U1Z4_9AGAR|nr:hypothetical protein BDP27DRAFT_1369140 [Rhodocollybia butyracea]